MQLADKTQLCKWIETKQQEAVQDLLDGSECEKARGRFSILDELKQHLETLNDE
ncbi:hypothetical protein [Vibrio galatheae]|uniref:hypothetical protein n=1 Tax=Vibrio galatheae TaxID=579748 RepID=UPI0012ED6B4C|nr:hypothetical protein [Vibrio galatheae]